MPRVSIHDDDNDDDDDDDEVSCNFSNSWHIRSSYAQRRVTTEKSNDSCQLCLLSKWRLFLMVLSHING